MSMPTSAARSSVIMKHPTPGAWVPGETRESGLPSVLEFEPIAKPPMATKIHPQTFRKHEYLIPYLMEQPPAAENSDSASLPIHEKPAATVTGPGLPIDEKSAAAATTPTGPSPPIDEKPAAIVTGPSLPIDEKPIAAGSNLSVSGNLPAKDNGSTAVDDASRLYFRKMTPFVRRVSQPWPKSVEVCTFDAIAEPTRTPEALKGGVKTTLNKQGPAAGAARTAPIIAGLRSNIGGVERPKVESQTTQHAATPDNAKMAGNVAGSDAAAATVNGAPESNTGVAKEPSGTRQDMQNVCVQSSPVEPHDQSATHLAPNDSSQGKPASEMSIGDHSFESANVVVPLSDRITLIGVTAHARFLAHAFASTPGRPPFAMFARHHMAMVKWGEENRTLVLYNAQGLRESSAAFLCPHPVFDFRWRYKAPEDSDFLDNVVIDSASAAIVPSIRRLSHRMDRRTTICIMHTGLGLVEQLNDVVFGNWNPLDRPNFIVCQSTYQISNVPMKMYSIQAKSKGTLYVSGVSKLEDTDSSSLAALESRQYTRHMIELLASTSGLQVKDLPWTQFLSVKLPWLVFCSLADAISVVLGCKYSQIRWNSYAQEMWENLLEEMIAIISALPELRCEPDYAERFRRPSFRRRLRTFLVAQGSNTSDWVRRVRMGNYPPIDYFNGWFVKRAKELGVDHKHNSLVIGIVKARANARRAELRNDVPLGNSPYMGDSDTIGGGQPVPMEEMLGIEEL